MLKDDIWKSKYELTNRGAVTTGGVQDKIITGLLCALLANQHSRHTVRHIRSCCCRYDLMNHILKKIGAVAVRYIAQRFFALYYGTIDWLISVCISWLHYQGITGSNYALKKHPASSWKGIILVESTQIRRFSWQLGRGGWSGRAIAQLRPRFSKLGLKGLSDFISNEIAVEVAGQEASGPNKRATLTKHLLKLERWTTALNLTEWRAQGRPPEKKHHR